MWFDVLTIIRTSVSHCVSLNISYDDVTDVHRSVLHTCWELNISTPPTDSVTPVSQADGCSAHAVFFLFDFSFFSK